MGTEVLSIPEESVPNVVRIIRAGLTVESATDDVAEALYAWCDKDVDVRPRL